MLKLHYRSDIYRETVPTRWSRKSLLRLGTLYPLSKLDQAVTCVMTRLYSGGAGFESRQRFCGLP
jgi:hypothetical protein